MKDSHIDKTWIGLLKVVGYGLMCVYSWLESKGIDAYAVFTCLGFMSFDMFLGVVKARKVKGLPNPSSREAKKGIITKAIMFTVPVICGLMWGLFDKSNAVKIANTLLIALTMAEGYSIIGNGYMIATGKVLSEYDAVTFFFKSVGNTIKILIEKNLK